MKYSAYPKYKKSGVEWLDGNGSAGSPLGVPEHWEIKRLKYCLSLNTKKAVTDENPIALENIESWTGRFIETESEFEGDGISFNAGDILFGKLRPYLAKIYLAEKVGESIGDIFVLRPSTQIISKYAAACLRTNSYIKIIDGSTYGSKMPRASWEFMGSLPFLLPTLPEQQAIAAFLDHETGRIDSLIGKKQKLIELLREKRMALISRSVTKGLNLTVKMKPSGVDWLGDVPEHWVVKQLKYVVRMKSGEGITSEEIQESDEYPVYGGNGLRGYFSNFTHNGHYVLIGRQGALCGNINYGKGKFWASEHAVVADPIAPIATLWLGELLRVMNLNQYSVSAAQPGLAIDKIKELIIPLPPLPEQQAIAAFLDRETSKIDTLARKVEAAIEKLKEYRAALISAAVTGKIDIREAL